MKRRRFKWGARKQKIATAIILVVKEELRKKTGDLAINISTEQLRKKTKKFLPDYVVPSSLDIINAIRGEANLGKNLNISKENGVEFITLYSSEMDLAYKIVQEKMRAAGSLANILPLPIAA